MMLIHAHLKKKIMYLACNKMTQQKVIKDKGPAGMYAGNTISEGRVLTTHQEQRHLDQCCSAECSAAMEILFICAVPCGCH